MGSGGTVVPAFLRHTVFTMKRVARWMAIGVAVLALLLAVGPFFIPVETLSAPATPAELAGTDGRFVTVPLAGSELDLHLQEAGVEGDALLLLHGFLASTFSFREILEPLGATYHVIAFDRPAFGLTERPMRGNWPGWGTLNPYSPEASVALTIGLMDELGIEQAVLIGNSAGGNLAVRTALAHPERVKALVLIDAAIYNQDANPFLHWLYQTPQMQHLGPLLSRQVLDWGQEFGREAWHDPAGLTDTVWAGYTRPLQLADWDRALWEFTAAANPVALDERLDEIDVPVLVITGDDNRIVPTADSIRLADALPNAQLAVLPACGHVPQEECPQPVLDVLLPFLAGLR